MPSMHITHHIGGYEVRPGARVPVDSNHEHIAFKLIAVCDAIDPERWHGEVMLAGTVIIRTGPVDSYERASREAESTLVARVVEVFSHSNEEL